MSVYEFKDICWWWSYYVPYDVLTLEYYSWKPISCLPRVKMNVLRATAQTRFPMVVEQLGHCGLCSFSLYLFFPLIYRLCYPSQGLFHLELLEIPLSVERHPSLVLSSHFRQARFGPDWIRQASQSFRHPKRMSDCFRKEILWQGKCLCLEDSRCMSMD